MNYLSERKKAIESQFVEVSAIESAVKEGDMLKSMMLMVDSVSSSITHREKQTLAYNELITHIKNESF